MGHHAPADSKDVVIPELVDTLEWVLESPPNVHQFDEPPVSFVLFYYYYFFIFALNYLLINSLLL